MQNAGMSNTLRDMVRRVSGIHDRIADDAGLKHAKVRCKTCGREQTVDGGHCFAHGWPKCHGQTMTLLPPTMR